MTPSTGIPPAPSEPEHQILWAKLVALPKILAVALDGALQNQRALKDLLRRVLVEQGCADLFADVDPCRVALSRPLIREIQNAVRALEAK